MIGLAPFAGMKLGVFHTLKHTFYKNDINIPNHINMIFGGFSGCVAVTFAYPLDLIRKRI
jgi:hypothetical protein